MNATDVANATNSSSFFLIVLNHPVISNALADQTFIMGNTFSFTIPVSTFVDQDGYTLEYSAFIQNGEYLNNLPSWISFDASKLTFVGSPTIEDIALRLILKIMNIWKHLK